MINTPNIIAKTIPMWKHSTHGTWKYSTRDTWITQHVVIIISCHVEHYTHHYLTLSRGILNTWLFNTGRHAKTLTRDQSQLLPIV